jgi:hypothetical protein
MGGEEGKKEEVKILEDDDGGGRGSIWIRAAMRRHE